MFKKPNTIVVDLRQEFHFLSDDIAFCLFSPNLTYNEWLDNASELISKELDIAKQFRGMATIPIYELIARNKEGKPKEWTQTIFASCNKIYTEEEVLKRFNIGYKRFPVTDHRFPKLQTVDSFLLWYKKLPPNTWLHFHCRAGRGRTTVFMMMVDMLKNKDKYTFEEYIQRHIEIGGIDIRNHKLEKPILSKHACNRHRMLYVFYHYAKRKCSESISFEKYAHLFAEGAGLRSVTTG